MIPPCSPAFYHAATRRLMMSEPTGKRIGLGSPSAIDKRPIALRPSCLRAIWSSYGVPVALCLLRGGVCEPEDRAGVRAESGVHRHGGARARGLSPPQRFS